MAVKKIINNPFYMYVKKHYCPKCNSKLDIIHVDKIVNSNSPEAKNFDFDNGENYMIGDVRFFWNEFKCNQCDFQATIKEMKQVEKNRKLQ